MYYSSEEVDERDPGGITMDATAQNFIFFSNGDHIPLLFGLTATSFATTPFVNNNVNDSNDKTYGCTHEYLWGGVVPKNTP